MSVLDGCEWNSPYPAHTKTPADKNNKSFSITEKETNILTKSGQQSVWYWLICTGVTGLSSHQTAVPLVVSYLLTQTVQLQLVDLQVWPNDTNPPSLFHFNCSTIIITNRASNMFTHCKPLRKAAYTSSSRSGWGILVGGSLVEPVNILLPYKARFSRIKQSWGRERQRER